LALQKKEEREREKEREKLEKENMQKKLADTVRKSQGILQSSVFFNFL
jgi:hypothetical protein